MVSDLIANHTPCQHTPLTHTFSYTHAHTHTYEHLQVLDEDASLVSDLIAENARLAQEVMMLRQSMNAAGTGIGTHPLLLSSIVHTLSYCVA